MAATGEIPVYSLQAQVYVLDKTQKWTPLTTDIVTVSFMMNEKTNATKIVAKEGDQFIVQSLIVPNMQYRRPSDTFVQWFDSQHVLYGLNLTSIADAEGFEREFEVANGKRPRKPAQSPNVTNLANKSAPQNGSSNSSSLQNSNSNLQSVAATPSGNSIEPRTRNVSMDQLSENMSKSTLHTSSSEAKLITSLKARIKELELHNMSLDGDRNSLNETIASQSKTISGLNNQIKQLEGDIDKLKQAFQQNSSNVNIWKQQLKTYQEVNEQLSSKMTELADLYDKFGDILKRE